MRSNSNSPIVPRHRLGQNFLIDVRTKQRIIAACGLSSSDTVLEIGAGLGALTEYIAPRVKKLVAVEIDRRLYEELKGKLNFNNVDLILADFLCLNLSTLPKNTKVIGNLPYYICSPIIAKLLNANKKFSSLFITVQLELGKRIIAKPNTKDYSAFTIFVQYHCDARMLFKIKSTSFRPAPKVQSCFMELRTRKRPVFSPRNPILFWKIVRQSFEQRRKTIPNALSRVLEKKVTIDILEKFNINPKSRAENLDIKDFVNISNAANNY